MKKTKVIIPALGLLVLSTAASVSGTVAWFSANTTVQATGMQLKGKAENGILISNEAKSTWLNTVAASNTGNNLEVVPTSTANASSWYHSSSNDADSAASNGTYTTLSTTVVSGVGFVDGGQPGNGAYDSATENAYFLLNKFYIVSSNEAQTKTLYVNTISVTGNSSSADFDKCFRVLVKYSDTVKIFAPFSGATLSYNVGGGQTPTAVTAISATGNVNEVLASNVSIPAYDDRATAALEISVYAYFEGEDENCKSTNIAATMDTLAISLTFGTVTVA